jgi:hypothetical protein
MSLHASSPRLAFADCGHPVCGEGGIGLFFLFLYFHGLKVLSLEDLMAIQAFDVVHAVSSGDDLGAGMLTRGLHKATLR